MLAELGFWATGRPRVMLEPLRGLFDLALDAEQETRVYIELKAASWLWPHQYDRQTEYIRAHGGRRAYVLLGPTYWAWHRMEGVTVIGLPRLADAISRVEPTIEEPGLLQLARAYAGALDSERSRWEGPLPPPSSDWRPHDWFRFFDDIVDAWSEPASMYPATNPGGQDLILNPEGAWVEVQGLGGDATIYWELVFGKVRFKVRWQGAPAHQRRIRDTLRTAYVDVAKDRGIVLERPRSRPGTHMSLAELSGDARERLLDHRGLDVGAALALLDEVTTLHEAVASHLGSPLLTDAMM